MKYQSLVVIVFLAALTACAASSVGPPPGTSRTGLRAPRASWIDPVVVNTKEPLLYVADTYANQVLVYKQRGHAQKPVGSITTDITFPVGVWVDKHENLWVANQNSEGRSTILRFRRGSTTPNLTIDDDYGWNIFAFWVNQKGAVYVSNVPYSGYFELLKYPPHATTPKIITDPNLDYVTTAIVGDATGDVFASGLLRSGGSEVDEKRAGSSNWKSTGIALGEAGALAFDNSGNLVVTDTGADVIETFKPAKTKPINTIDCTAQCVSIAFNHTGTHLWVDEFNDSNGTIEEYSYPAGKLLNALPQPNGSSPESVAASPDLYP